MLSTRRRKTSAFALSGGGPVSLVAMVSCDCAAATEASCGAGIGGSSIAAQSRRARRCELSAGGVRVQPFLDDAQQLVGIGGLGEVVVEAGLHRAAAVGRLAVAGQCDQ